MPRSLLDKVALVTGASSGIGRATSLAFAAAGAKLSLVARREDRLKQLVSEIRANGGQAEAFACDVAAPQDMEAAVTGCIKTYGRLDLLINNAGQGLFASVEQTSPEDLDRMLAINLKGIFYGIKAALPVMRSQRAGHIINVASTAGLRGSPYVGAYCASKFAVVGLTESLRAELQRTGISVSLVCPGATRTEFFTAAERRTDQHPGLVGPVERAEQVAARILRVAKRHSARVMAQPVRRTMFLMLNLLAPAVVDRLLIRLLNSNRALSPATH